MSSSPLPTGVSAGSFSAALAAFRSALGEAGVLDTDQDRRTYIDPYAFGDGLSH